MASSFLKTTDEYLPYYQYLVFMLLLMYFWDVLNLQSYHIQVTFKCKLIKT